MSLGTTSPPNQEGRNLGRRALHLARQDSKSKRSGGRRQRSAHGQLCNPPLPDHGYARTRLPRVPSGCYRLEGLGACGRRDPVIGPDTTGGHLKGVSGTILCASNHPREVVHAGQGGTGPLPDWSPNQRSGRGAPGGVMCHRTCTGCSGTQRGGPPPLSSGQQYAPGPVSESHTDRPTHSSPIYTGAVSITMVAPPPGVCRRPTSCGTFRLSLLNGPSRLLVQKGRLGKGGASELSPLGFAC